MGTWSSLTDVVILTDHYDSRGGNSIKKITIHHMAGNLTAEECGYVFQTREASANYGIDSQGRVGCYVPEEYRAWSTANPDNDSQAINIELANDGGSPDWHVSDTAIQKCVELCVDICQRYGIEEIVYNETPSGNLTRHNMFMSTTCPGPYLQGQFYNIAYNINQGLKGKINYRAYVEDYGWQNWKHDGQPAGTTGSNKRLEALQIDAPFEVKAKAHIQDKGWVDYGVINKDTVIGTTDEAKRIECLCFKGDFKYRVHIQESGWTCWTNADGICTLGSVGQGLRIECIEIKPL